MNYLNEKVFEVGTVIENDNGEIVFDKTLPICAVKPLALATGI